MEFLNRALLISHSHGERGAEAITLNNIGAVYSDLGDKQKSLESYLRALPLAVSISDPVIQANIFLLLMHNKEDTQPSLAIFYGKRAVNLLQQVRGGNESLDKELQKSFVESKDNYYHDLASLLISQGRLPEAQQVLDMMKLSEFEQFTRDSKRNQHQSASLTTEEQAAEDAYQLVSQQIFQIADAKSILDASQEPTDSDKKRVAVLEEQLTTANRALSNLMNSLPSMLVNKGQVQRAEDMTKNIPGLKDLMRNIAEPGTVALYTLVTDNYYRVIVIRNDGRMVERHTKIPMAMLRKAVARYMELLSMRPGTSGTHNVGNSGRTAAQTAELWSLAAKLYTTLIAPIAADLEQARARTLVWELDGALHYVPLGTLYDPVAKRFLAESYASVVTTPKDQHKLHTVPDLTGVRLLALGLSRSIYDKDFGSLPNVPQELAAIVRDPSNPTTHGVLPGSEWLDLDFTENRLIGELKSANGGNSRPYKIVHIASHFNADPTGNTKRSFMLLAGQKTALDQNGGGFHLTLDDLANAENLQEIFRGVDLLTLSACQTAVTVQNGNGHEIDGLAGVAQERGADAVVASLWSVDDKSTANFMRTFYTLWTDPAKNLSKAEALRQTQLRMLRLSSPSVTDATKTGSATTGADNAAAIYRDPYYWAPFILMGNWK